MRFRSLSVLLSRGARDERGAIAIVFALLLVPLLLFTGGAIDFSRYHAVRADLIESLDAAGLAMAQLDALDPPEIRDLSGSERETALKEYGRNFFNENFQHQDLIDDLTIDFEVTAATITPNATGTVRTLVLAAAEPLVGGDTHLTFLDMTTTTEITRRGSGRIELALVLDVTGSMGDPVAGVDKIDSLREAVDNLLGTMFGEETTSSNLKMAVVPFNLYTNPAGSAAWDSSWTDGTALAPYHGSRFFHVTQAGAVDMNTKVNHLRLHESVTAGNGWKGCVEERPYPLDELDTVPGQAVTTGFLTTANTVPSATDEPDARVRLAFTRAPALKLAAATVAAANASRWVPLFRADEPDCKNDDPSHSNNGGACQGAWPTPSSTPSGLAAGIDRETYNIGAGNVTVEMNTSYIDHPGNDGWSASSYANRRFITDERYTDRNEAGEHDAKYWRIVNAYRTTMQGGTSAFKTFMTNLGGADYTTDEYVLRNAYVGWWNPTSSVYTNKYDISPSIDETISDDDETMRGPNEDCPEAILPLTNDRTAVEAKVDALHPNGNTNSANGMAWGWRVLSPTAPFTEGTSYDDGDWQKAVVLMTDGENTMSNVATHWGSSPSAYGYEIEQRMGNGVNNADDGNSNNFVASSMRDHVDEKLLRICRRMKQEGILVYTIVFGLNNTNLEQVFKSCATSPTAPYYYKAPTGAQLEAAFGNIAQDLVNLHVSR